MTRRQFLYLSGMAAAGSVALTGCASSKARKLGPNDKLNIGAVGAGGKGSSDIAHCAGENIVAICDVDEKKAAETLGKFPRAKFYRDWRSMLEREASLDAVLVSTPDHNHAIIAAEAIRLRKAVYCQKPLTYSVQEARFLRNLAREYGVVTQMGNQGSAENGLRRAVEVIKSGLIGQVRNVHVWSNRPIWPQGIERPPGEDPVPPGLDWDLWLGPAPHRPYKEGVYHPFKWRGWQDFGTGALGDMACHTVNMPFRALDFGYPTRVVAETSGMNTETYPKDSRIHFTFPARGNWEETEFWWYDGGRKPDDFLLAHVKKYMGKVPGSGCLLVGDKGLLFSPDDYGAKFFLKLNGEDDFSLGTQHPAVSDIPQTIPRNPFKGDADRRHHLEWIAACKGEGSAYSGFDVAAFLTEIVLLGCVAMRTGERLEWDGPNMRAKNTDKAAQFVQREYRQGWKL